MKKVCFLCQANIGPYHVARFNQAQNNFTEITVLRVNVKEYYRPWHAEGSRFTQISVDYESNSHKMSDKLLNILKEICPDVIVSAGYAVKIFRDASVWAKSQNILSIMAFDSWGQNKHWWYPKEIAKKIFCPKL
jgi:hypothetical protein